MSRDPEEAWSNDYDSTWDEDDEPPRGPKEPGTGSQTKNCRRCMSRAAQDLQSYRHGYVNDKRDRGYSSTPSQTPNLEFYRNNRRFDPDGLLIEELLKKWKGNYDILEKNHSYIQWLFPLREYGMNSYAKPLTIAEIEVMKHDKDIQRRFVEAYKLMLNFYGIELNDKTGKVTHAKNWEDRFKNLNDHSHNNLRITRILKCLGELGFERYQAPLVMFFLQETLCNRRLQNVKRSALDYFMFTVKDKSERRKLVHYAWKNYNQERFLWGPVDKLRTYKPPAENEHKTKDYQKEKNDESNEEGKRNGKLEICKNYSDEEGLKECSDSLSSQNVERKPDSLKPDKKSSEECIPLTNRVEGTESHGKFPQDSGRCSEAVSDNQGLFSNSSSDCTNGVQLPTEDVGKKSPGEKRNQVCYEVSPKLDHKVPSLVGHQEEGKVKGLKDGTASSNRNEDLQQDSVHIKIDPIQPLTPRKRKIQTVGSNGEGMSNRGPPQSEDHSGLPKEGREGSDKDQVKKLKWQPVPERNEKVADTPSSSLAGRYPKQSGDGSDRNQEEGVPSQLDNEEAKEEILKMLEQSNSEKGLKKEDDPSSSSSSGDSKSIETESGSNREGAEKNGLAVPEAKVKKT